MPALAQAGKFSVILKGVTPHIISVELEIRKESLLQLDSVPK
jgi:hypothetical protein